MDFANELIKLAPDNPGVADLLETIARHPFLPSLNRIQNTTREIGLEKLALFPEKLSSMTEATFDTSYPISVELSLTNACNLKCQWCSDSQLRKTRPGAIPFRAYSNLVDDLAAHGTRGLVLEGGGEPTVHPQFRDAVQLAADKGLAVGVITNGVKFDYIDLLPKLEWIRVSLDADCAETFHRIKGYDYFYQVMANIRSMCEARQSCVIGIGYVVSNQNLEHLEEITMLLCEYGADYIYLRPVIDHPELRINRDLLYLKKYETDQFSVMIHAMAENSVTGNSGVPCVANSLSSVICADGSVFLCGRLNIHPWVKPIGNICTESFDALWHGEERRRQTAKAMDAGFCRQWCPECRLTKYNTILAATRRIRTRNFI
jgi:MoaA/NifB/PqqE/SkfB family radical SAM enzyme